MALHPANLEEHDWQLKVVTCVMVKNYEKLTIQHSAGKKMESSQFTT